jgi:CheY-like chemotaxis protein
MSQARSPRLLVVDDDPCVVAAYKLVLDKDKQPDTVQHLFGLDDLEAELFGASTAKEEETDWRIQFFNQGVDAVAEVRHSIDTNDPIAAIFLDVRMPPGIDGYETAKRIRELDREVHIVIVTGFSDYAYEDFLLVAGPAHKLTYLPKPIWPDELRRIAQVLTRETSHRALLSPHRAANRTV